MGLHCELKELFWFIYKAPFDNGLTEHELDHVLVGTNSKNPIINPSEVANFKWNTLQEVEADIEANPHIYTVWFKIIFKEYLAHLK